MNKICPFGKLLVTALLLLVLGCSTSPPPDIICVETESTSHPAKGELVTELTHHQVLLDSAIATTGEFLFEFKHDFIAVQRPVVVRFKIRIRMTGPNPKLRLVTSLRDENQDVFWEGFALENAIENPGEWQDIQFEMRFPLNQIQNRQLVTYLWNPEKLPVDLEYFELTIESETMPSFLPGLPSPELSGDFEIVAESERYQIHFYPRNGHVVVADNQSVALTRPIGWTIEYTKDDLNYSCQQFTWQRPSHSGEDGKLTGSIHSGELNVDVVLNIESLDNSGGLQVHFETTANADIVMQRLALNVPLEESIEQVFDAYGNQHQRPASGEFHLPKGGFVAGSGSRSISVYHATGLSSIQLNAADNHAFFNLDYQWDHPLMHFPLHADSSDYFVDRSAATVKAGQAISASIPIFIGSGNNTLPRFLSVPGGYNAALIFTEHSDWTNMQTHRAVCFGQEDIKTAEAATGGFVKYAIPVTKSVFYDNPDSVVNTRASDSLFNDLHTSIRTDPEFLPFLKMLEKQGFEICLHTPAQFTDSREQTEEALRFMQQQFGSPTWIDHGYNNAPINNRENVVCDGLNENASHFSRDLWQQHGVRYFWHPYFEDDPVYSPFGFSSHLQMPYPGFGAGFPYFPISRHPDFSEALLWYTTNLTAPADEGTWDFIFNFERLSELASRKGIYISHMYPAWVRSGKGFWVFDEDGKIVANPGFNRALERIAQFRDNKLILPTTISGLLNYYEAIHQVEYQITGSRSVSLRNSGEDIVHDLSMVIAASEVIIDGERPQSRSHDGELIFWFDLPAGETVQIEWQ